MHLIISTPHRLVTMFLCFPPPYPPVAVEWLPPSPPPRRKYGYLLPSSRNSQLDQCCLFAMICWTIALFYPVHPYLPCPSSHCAAALTFFPMSFFYIYPVSYPSPCIILTSFRHCFLNHTRIISVFHLCRSSSPPLFCSR
jgi:hypothetical protein